MNQLFESNPISNSIDWEPERYCRATYEVTSHCGGWISFGWGWLIRIGIQWFRTKCWRQWQFVYPIYAYGRENKSVSFSRENDDLELTWQTQFLAPQTFRRLSTNNEKIRRRNTLNCRHLRAEIRAVLWIWRAMENVQYVPTYCAYQDRNIIWRLGRPWSTTLDHRHDALHTRTPSTILSELQRHLRPRISMWCWGYEYHQGDPQPDRKCWIYGQWNIWQI